MTSNIEALRAALAAEAAAVLGQLEDRTNQTWAAKRTRAATLVRGLLAEVDKAQRSAAHWHECFQVLERAIVGETGASAIDEAKRLRAEVDRQKEVIGSLNARCDHLGMSLRDIKAERDGLTAARIAYASEFAPNADGEPDVGSIHQNIRALKAEREALRAALVAMLDGTHRDCGQITIPRTGAVRQAFEALDAALTEQA
jgi:hypothetical protein